MSLALVDGYNCNESNPDICNAIVSLQEAAEYRNKNVTRQIVSTALAGCGFCKGCVIKRGEEGFEEAYRTEAVRILNGRA